jgi:hypothetical protein
MFFKFSPLSRQYNMQLPTHLESLLCMSTKYIVDSVYAAVLQALHVHFPRTVQNWNMRRCLSHPLETKLLVLDSTYEANATLLLPSLYYALCDNTLAEIRDAKLDLPHSIFTAYATGKEKLATEISVFISDCISSPGRACPTCDRAWCLLQI